MKKKLIPGLLLGFLVSCTVLVQPADHETYCGDGIFQAELDEQCDSTDFGGKTCRSQGFAGGELACDKRCRLVTSGCTHEQRPEICDNGVDDDGDGLTDCDDADCVRAPNCFSRDVDLLFLIDSSASMVTKQARLAQGFPALLRELEKTTGGMPNLHIGTITPDLGSSTYNVPNCDIQGGDKALFIKGINNSCINPVNDHFVVDVEPRNCTIFKDPLGDGGGSCEWHSCEQFNCSAGEFHDPDNNPTEPADLILVVDENNCPRCRNFVDEDLESVFSCMTDIGSNGCGFEQQLEALHLAITTNHQRNRLFFRPGAHLVIVLVTDEDDCSVLDKEIFNPSEEDQGFLSSFRCWEFGVICDEPWERTWSGGDREYTGCRPRESGDPKSKIHPISRYEELLSSWQNAGRLVVSAITGPLEDTVTVALDHSMRPAVKPSCGELGEGGDPAVRIRAFVETFIQDPEDLDWTFYNICESTYVPVFEQLGIRIRSLTDALQQ